MGSVGIRALAAPELQIFASRGIFSKHLTEQWEWQCWSEPWWGGCWVCWAPSRCADGFGCSGEGFIWGLALLGAIPGSCVCICQLLALMDFVANLVWSLRSLIPRMCPSRASRLPGPRGHWEVTLGEETPRISLAVKSKAELIPSPSPFLHGHRCPPVLA